MKKSEAIECKGAFGGGEKGIEEEDMLNRVFQGWGGDA